MAQQDWIQKNQQYLVDSINEIEILLRRFIARSQGKQQHTKQDEEEEKLEEDKKGRRAGEMIDDSLQPPALGTICKLFGLSAFESSILLLCAAVELKTEISILCAKAHEDPNSTYPTFGLALAFLPDAHWSALAPMSPLRRFRLISLYDYPHTIITKCPIRIEERVLHYLTGISYLDKRLWSMMVRPIRVQAPLSFSQQHIAERILLAWRKNNSSTSNSNSNDIRGDKSSGSHNSQILSDISCVQLWGPDEISKEIIARWVCNKLGLNLWQISGEFMPLKPDELEVFSDLWCREASLLGCGLYISAEDVVDPLAKKVISKLLTSTYLPRPLFLGTRDRWPSLELSHAVSFELNKPMKLEQRKMWKESMNTIAARLASGFTRDDDIELSKLTSNYDFNAFTIMSAFNQALLYIKDGDEDDSDRSFSPSSSTSTFISALWKSCRNIARPEMSGLATQIIPKAAFKDLVLPDIQKQLLDTISIRVKHRGKVYEDWGFETISSRGLGITALFTGESGTGKTMAAEALANNLDLDLFKIDLSTVVSKYIGETEKNLHRVFDAAESGGAILFFDEADALFGKRSEVKDSHDRHANIEVGYLLQRMEEYHGLAILATNMKNALDPAFIRRIAFIVKFPFPDEKSRAEIWKRIFPRTTPIEKNLDFGRLAKLNITGGSIRNIALNASFFAAEEDAEVGMRHLKKATRLEYDKLERPLTQAEIHGW